MPTYAQLQTEPVWGAQFTPPALKRCADRLGAHFGVPVWIGGDNEHVYGRHRSRNWCLTSRFCTNRAYGTTDARDKRGDGNWYRAGDVALKGQPLWDACRRLDAAVRAGRLPGLAEWFGTYDGKTVVGWFEGKASTSDASHLTHLHFGVWTEVANDDAFMGRLFAVITGTEEDDMTPEQEQMLREVHSHMKATDQRVREVLVAGSAEYDDLGQGKTRPWQVAALKDIQRKTATPPTVDVAALAKALLADPDFKAALAQAAKSGAAGALDGAKVTSTITAGK